MNQGNVTTRQSTAFANSHAIQVELEDVDSVTTQYYLASSNTVNVKSDDKHHHGDEDEHSEAHDCLHSRIGYSIKDLILVGLWFILVGIYIWYLVEVFITVDDQIKHPTTSVSYIEQVPKTMPQVTICNWNSGYYCGESCNLTLVGCSKVGHDGYAVECSEHDSKPRYVQYGRNGNLFNCYQYNYDPHEPIEVSTTGYQGSVSLYFKVPDMPSSDLIRKGLQVTFNNIGEVPNVFDETNYCLTNVDNFFTLTHTQVERLKSELSTERYEINYSRVYLSGNMTVVSFGFSSLNLAKVKEVQYTTGPDMLAKVCEMLLILVGIDFIKIVRGVLLIPEAIRHKTVKEIFETFI